jgi:hypothetical protein
VAAAASLRTVMTTLPVVVEGEFPEAAAEYPHSPP